MGDGGDRLPNATGIYARLAECACDHDARNIEPHLKPLTTGETQLRNPYPYHGPLYL